jgi:hypothetical protein
MGYCEQFYYNIVYKTSNKLQCMQFFLNKKNWSKGKQKKAKNHCRPEKFSIAKESRKNTTKIHTGGVMANA